MRYTLSILVQNQSGVLSRVVSLFSRRGYNIDSLVVAPTEDPTVSRMTICGQGDDYILEQMEKQLNKLVPVIKVRSLGENAVSSELMLVKIACDTGQIGELNEIAKLLGAEVVDVSPEAVVLRLAGDPQKCDTLYKLVKPFGVREVSRTGLIALEK